MKLRDFIADALMEVHHGVQNAIVRRDKEQIAGRISPAFLDPTGQPIDWTKQVQSVEFDVAVTESSAKEASAEGGLEVFSFGKLGGKGATRTEQSAVNRIRFSVPILLPVQVTQPTGF
jgi:hypothetical protein